MNELIRLMMDPTIRAQIMSMAQEARPHISGSRGAQEYAAGQVGEPQGPGLSPEIAREVLGAGSAPIGKQGIDPARIASLFEDPAVQQLMSGGNRSPLQAPGLLFPETQAQPFQPSPLTGILGMMGVR